MTRNTRFGAGLATAIACLGWAALAVEFAISMTKSLAKGRSLAEALFLFFRYFTILTNIGVAVLMTVTVIRTLRSRPLPPARLYAVALVYITVVFVTYEAMLRGQWSPRGIQFYTDLTIHDVVPVLSVVFWFAFAPKQGLRWVDALALLIFPAIYFAVTLFAGVMGQDYPYGFLDVSKLGYPGVLTTAVWFLAIFYTLGLAAIAFGRSVPRTGSGKCASRPPRRGVNLRSQTAVVDE